VSDLTREHDQIREVHRTRCCWSLLGALCGPSSAVRMHRREGGGARDIWAVQAADLTARDARLYR
jgi:hypothetical protein